MRIDLNYGPSHLTIDVPADTELTLFRKPPMPIAQDPHRLVRDALLHPVDSAPLSDLARQAESACIAICDITRPVPNHLFLRPLIETLLQAGMPAEKICVVVATGLHRPNTGAELEQLLGDPWVQRHVQVTNHDARDDAQHVHLGRTSRRGTAVRIDRRFAEADLKIATGLVEPHFMAGYSGGRKVIAPGLAHAETITTFHNARFMSDVAATNCNLTGNPLHEEQLEIVRLLGGALAVNTVIDEERQLAFVNFGEIVASPLEAVAFARRYCEVPADRRFSTVLTSAAGYPLDKTYYQTIKGMLGALDILAPGGNLLIASACSEGLGSPEFIDSQRRLVELGPSAFLNSISHKSQAAIDEWQTQKQVTALAAGSIQLFSSGLSTEEAALTGVTVVPCLQQALVDSLAASADRALAVIPEGPYVVPYYQAPSATLSG